MKTNSKTQNETGKSLKVSDEVHRWLRVESARRGQRLYEFANALLTKAMNRSLGRSKPADA